MNNDNDNDNDNAKRLPSMMKLLRQLMKHIRALHDGTESGSLSITCVQLC